MRPAGAVWFWLIFCLARVPDPVAHPPWVTTAAWCWLFLCVAGQYWLVAAEQFDLFTVFIPVYVFLAIPVVSALANDPQRFLERNAKLQWGIMVCIYGMSHVPALMLLDFPTTTRKAHFWCCFWCWWCKPAW
jgi:predicted CDP-diglyceride synthetase/phosphatidate cytidylyltransferase